MDVKVTLAYWLYVVWLLAGSADFLCHRVTDLPHTSGVAESATHLLQLLLLGTGVVVGMAFQASPTVAVVLMVLVIAHATVGYIDTYVAFSRRRVLLPIEQHIHSVLDMAPIVALGTWPAAIDGEFRPRDPALPWVAWVAVLLPAVVLCLVPALFEFQAAMRARRGHG